MTPAERQKQFRTERARQWKLGVDLKLRTRETVLSLLADASKLIAARLAGEPSEWEAYRLPSLQNEVRRQMSIFQAVTAETLIGGLRESWDLGQALIDAPLRVADINLSGMLTRLDTGVLMAMQSFATDKVADITTGMVNRVNAELAKVIMGAQTPFQAAGKVAAILGPESGSAGRARTIVNDEVGRAYSLAGQKRMDQATPVLPGLRKQWRKSGKREARHTHVMADGQIVKPSEPFVVGGIKIICPRDPAAPVEHTINCGCTSLPIMKSWEVVHPLEKPFSDADLAASPVARRAQDVRHARAEAEIRDVLAGKVKPAGKPITVGNIEPHIQKAIREAGGSLVTTQIAVGDRALLHMVRTSKQARGTAVPPGLVEQLPTILSAPRDVFLEQRPGGPQLLYTATVPGEQRVATFAIKLRDRDTRMQVQRHNYIATATMIDPATLADGKRFQRVV